MATTDTLLYYLLAEGTPGWISKLNTNFEEVEEDMLKTAQSHWGETFAGMVATIPGTYPPPAGTKWFSVDSVSPQYVSFKVWPYDQDAVDTYYEAYDASKWREVYKIDRSVTPSRVMLDLSGDGTAGQVNLFKFPNVDDIADYPAAYEEEGAIVRLGTNLKMYDATLGDFRTLNCPIIPTTDHGSLTGLTDDDHTQYLRTDGTRTLTDHMEVTAYKRIDGVDVGAAILDGSGGWYVHSCVAVSTAYGLDDGTIKDIEWGFDTEFAAAEGIHVFDRKSAWTLECILSDGGVPVGYAQRLKFFDDYLFAASSDGHVFRRDFEGTWTHECALAVGVSYHNDQICNFVEHDNYLWAMGYYATSHLWRRARGAASAWTFVCTLDNVTGTVTGYSYAGRLFIGGIGGVNYWDGVTWTLDCTITLTEMCTHRGMLYGTVYDIPTSAVYRRSVEGTWLLDETLPDLSTVRGMVVYDDSIWIASDTEIIQRPIGTDTWSCTTRNPAYGTQQCMRAVRGELQIGFFGINVYAPTVAAYHKPMRPVLDRVVQEALRGDGSTLVYQELPAAEGAKIDNVAIKEMLLRGSNTFKPVRKPPMTAWNPDLTWNLTTTKYFLGGVETESGLFIVFGDTSMDGTGSLYIMKYDGRNWVQKHTKSTSNHFLWGRRIVTWGGYIVVSWAGSSDTSGGFIYSSDGGETWSEYDTNLVIDCLTLGYGGGGGAAGFWGITHGSLTGSQGDIKLFTGPTDTGFAIDAVGAATPPSGEIVTGLAVTRNHVAIATDVAVRTYHVSELVFTAKDVFTHGVSGIPSDAAAYQGNLYFLVHDSSHSKLYLWDTTTETLGALGSAAVASLPQGFSRLQPFGARLLALCCNSYVTDASDQNIWAVDGVAGYQWKSSISLLGASVHPAVWANTLYLQPWTGSGLIGALYEYTESINHTMAQFMQQFNDGRAMRGTS